MQAYASADVKLAGFSNFITEHVSHLRKKYSNTGLAQVVGSAAKCGVDNRTLMKALAKDVKTRVSLFPPSTLCQLVTGFAALGIYSRQLMRNASKIFSVHLADMSINEISSVLKALGTFAYRDEKFARKLCTVVLKRPSELNSQSIVESFTGLFLIFKNCF